MQLQYDEDLIEGAVFRCARGRRPPVPPLQVARFHREREAPYRLLDPDARAAAFYRVHLGWFREWGLEAPLTALVQAFPRLRTALDRLAFRQARGPKEEGAELYVNSAGRRTAVVALRPERFADPVALADWLRHEFTHLDDMLDPAFGYARELELEPGAAAAGAFPPRLALDRYRLLWDLSIDGRLTAAGHRPAAARAAHECAFAGAFGVWPAERKSRVFDRLWTGSRPRHAELAAWATDPRGVRQERRPVPGAPCPLCGFATFDWSDVPALAPALTDAIRAEFPSWTLEQGVCGRCREAYEVLLARPRAAALANCAPASVELLAG